MAAPLVQPQTPLCRAGCEVGTRNRVDGRAARHRAARICIRICVGWASGLDWQQQRQRPLDWHGVGRSVQRCSDCAGHATAALSGSGQHRHAVLAGGGGGRGAVRASTGFVGHRAQRGGIRLLLRAATLQLRRQRCSVPCYFRSDVDGGLGGGPAHRVAALPSSGGTLPRRPRAQPVRDGTRTGLGVDAGTDCRDQRQIRRAGVSGESLGAVPRCTRPARERVGQHRQHTRGRCRLGAVGLRPRRSGRCGHRHPACQPRALRATEGPHAHARCDRGGASQPAAADDP